MDRTQLQATKQQYTKRELWALYGSQCLDDTLALLELQTFQKQDVILRGNRKMTIIRSARRTSKSFSIAIKVYSLLYFGTLFDYDMRMTLGGPVADDTRNAWRYLNQFWGRAPLTDIFPETKLEYNNWESRSTNKKQWEFSGGTYVHTASCDSPRMGDIRGDALDFCGIDEFGNVPYKEDLLAAMLYALKDDEPLGFGWLIGTHDINTMGQEFNQLFKLGQEGNPEIESFTLIGADNPYSRQDDADLVKGLVSDSTYRREEMGEAVPHGGRLFPDFDSREHDKSIPYDPNRPHIGCVDFGFNKPYSCCFQPYYVDGVIHVNVTYEFSPKKYRIDRYVKELKVKNQEYCQGNMPEVVGSDKAGNSEQSGATHTDFQKLKKVFHTARLTTNSMLVSKANQVTLLLELTTGKRIHIDKECHSLIRSFAMATPDMNSMGAINSAGWKKVKGLDDPLDGLCYGLINYGPTSELIGKRHQPRVMNDPQSAYKLAQQMADI